MRLILPAIVLAFVFSFLANAQDLPNLDIKPTPKFQHGSFCPKQGLINSSQDDPELNMAKNRLDDNPTYFTVDFDAVEGLHNADAAGKKRSSWTQPERERVEKFEGIPVMLEGFLALVNNGPKNHPRMEGARPEGKESCNCDSEKPARIDFHIWLLRSPSATRAHSVVVEVTPRVRTKHPRWIVKDFTFIAAKKYPVRVSGWLMFDGQHPEQIGNTRGTLWEIHPIMKVEYNQNGTWKTL